MVDDEMLVPPDSLLKLIFTFLAFSRSARALEILSVTLGLTSLKRTLLELGDLTMFDEDIDVEVLALESKEVFDA